VAERCELRLSKGRFWRRYDPSLLELGQKFERGNIFGLARFYLSISLFDSLSKGLDGVGACVDECNIHYLRV
jgi:hypothetical protein